MVELVHFVNPERTEQEYVVIYDPEDCGDELEEFVKPGFEMRSRVELLGDVSSMPTNRELSA